MGSHLEGSEQRSDDLLKRIALAAVQRTEYRGERRSRETTLEAILAVQAGNDAGLHHGGGGENQPDSVHLLKVESKGFADEIMGTI